MLSIIDRALFSFSRCGARHVEFGRGNAAGSRALNRINHAQYRFLRPRSTRSVWMPAATLFALFATPLLRLRKLHSNHSSSSNYKSRVMLCLILVLGFMCRVVASTKRQCLVPTARVQKLFSILIFALLINLTFSSGYSITNRVDTIPRIKSEAKLNFLDSNRSTYYLLHI